MSFGNQKFQNETRKTLRKLFYSESKKICLFMLRIINIFPSKKKKKKNT